MASPPHKGDQKIARTLREQDARSPVVDKTLPASVLPEMIGRYRIVKKLGEGGMGMVFAARDENLKRAVAIKLLQTSDSHNPALRKRFLREAQAMARLSHRNVIAVHDVGTHDNQDFIAMEYLEGQTLSAWLAAKERSWPEILQVFAQAGEGLAAAHAAGIVHRDFKPDNVMILGDGERVVVLDFGLADASAGDEIPNKDGVQQFSAPPKLTVAGAVMGTPAYMAPEQHRGESTDARTDIFAFGVALYEALFRRRPFPGSTYREIAASVLTGNLIEPPDTSDVPLELRSALRTCLEVEAQARWQDMGALLQTLTPAPKAEVPKRGRGLRVAMIALVLVGVAAATFVGLSSRSSERSAPLARESGEGADTDAVAEIIASSQLPPLQTEPLADDPTQTTVHRLSNGLTVFISPKKSEPRIYARVSVRSGYQQGAEYPRAFNRLLVSLLRSGTERVGTIDYEAERPQLDEITRLYQQLEAASSQERAPLLAQIRAKEEAAASLAISMELVSLMSQWGQRYNQSEAGLDQVAILYDFPSNRLADWAELESDRWANSVLRQFSAAVDESMWLDEKSRGESEGILAAAWEAMSAGHPHGQRRLDGASWLKQYPYSEVEKYYATWFVPNNAALFLEGDIDRRTALPVLEAAFSHWRPKALPSLRAWPAVEARARSQVETVSGSQESVSVAWYIPNNEMSKSPALGVLTSLMAPDGPGLAGEFSPLQRMKVSREGRREGAMLTLRVPGAKQDQTLILKNIDALVERIKAGDFDERLVLSIKRLGLYRRYRQLDSRLSASAFANYAWLAGESWDRMLTLLRTQELVTKLDVLAVAKELLRSDARVVVHSMPDPKASPQVPPPKRPEYGKGTSELVAEVAKRKEVVASQPLLREGVDYEIGTTAQGEIVATRVPEMKDFALTLRFATGSASLGLLCAVLSDPSSLGTSALGRQRLGERLAELGAEIDADCGESQSSLVLRGLDSTLEESLSIVFVALQNPDLSQKDWGHLASSYLEGRWRQLSVDLDHLVEALMAYAVHGPSSAAELLQEQPVTAPVAEALSTVRKLSAMAMTLEYRGPRRVEELTQLIAPHALPVSKRDRAKMPKRSDKTRILWLEHEHESGEMQVRMAFRTSDASPKSLVARSLLRDYLLQAIRGANERLSGARWNQGVEDLLSIELAQGPLAVEDLAAVMDILGNLQTASIEKAIEERRSTADWQTQRTLWYAQEDVPALVSEWRRAGITGDRRQLETDAVATLELAYVKGLAELEFAKPFAILLVAGPGQVDAAALRKLGDVVKVPLEDLICR